MSIPCHPFPRLSVSRERAAIAAAALLLFTLVTSPSVSAGGDSYDTSNAGIKNIQASFPTTAGATDHAGACVQNAPYNNHHSESWVAVDPTNASHIVGVDKFFFDPAFYLFHIGANVTFDGGQTWTNEVIPGFDCHSNPSNSWMDTTDPILAFDLAGNLYSTMLPFSMTYNPQNAQVFNAIPNSAISVVKSTDGGATWSTPFFVNDVATVNDGTDQFQPSVAASPNGTVAVAFYDRRLACPASSPNILPADVGRTNFCINTSIQFFSDGAGGLTKLGSNIRVTQATWDPQNPGATTKELPMPGGPNGSLTFIGDYFGLALSSKNAYVLFVSNYNLGQNPANDQQQFLATVPIPSTK
jgi:hypothetical protein